MGTTTQSAGTASVKPFLPTTKKDKVILLVLVGFIIAASFAAFGTEYVGYPKVAGLSMEPTIHQPLYVPFGTENIRHRGAYVHIDADGELEVGSIVMFRHGKERDVKRVAYIRASDGAVWVTADNVGVTGADSREYGWISRADVMGVVDKIITPQRLVRNLTAAGRITNQMEFWFGPNWRKLDDSLFQFIAPTTVGVMKLENGRFKTLFSGRHVSTSDIPQWRYSTLTYQETKDVSVTWHSVSGRFTRVSRLAETAKSLRVIKSTNGYRVLPFWLLAESEGGRPKEIDIPLSGQVQVVVTCTTDLPVEVELGAISRPVLVLHQGSQILNFPCGGKLRVRYGGSAAFPTVFVESFRINQAPARTGA